MTSSTQESQPQTHQDKVLTDKELNFRALEAKFQRQLESERQARIKAEEELQKISQAEAQSDDEEDTPYVDHKKLQKKLNTFGQTTQSEIQKAMEIAKQAAKEELKQEIWLENNRDFYDTLKHADKFAEKAPQLADSILRMPDSFEKQKLVYQNIKALGIDKPEQKQPTIQDKIEANKRSPYYQPSGIANSPHLSGGDFSATGQKAAYEKLQQLKKGLRL